MFFLTPTPHKKKTTLRFRYPFLTGRSAESIARCLVLSLENWIEPLKTCSSSQWTNQLNKQIKSSFKVISTSMSPRKIRKNKDSLRFAATRSLDLKKKLKALLVRPTIQNCRKSKTRIKTFFWISAMFYLFFLLTQSHLETSPTSALLTLQVALLLLLLSKNPGRQGTCQSFLFTWLVSVCFLGVFGWLFLLC